MELTIEVIGSMCAKTIVYGRLVTECLQAHGIEGNIVKVKQTDRFGMWNGQNLFETYDLCDRCRIAYCCGCNFFPESEPDDKYMPALVVNGSVQLHSCFPTKEKIDEIITSHLRDAG